VVVLLFFANVQPSRKYRSTCQRIYPLVLSTFRALIRSWQLIGLLRSMKRKARGGSALGIISDMYLDAPLKPGCFPSRADRPNWTSTTFSPFFFFFFKILFFFFFCLTPFFFWRRGEKKNRGPRQTPFLFFFFFFPRGGDWVFFWEGGRTLHLPMFEYCSYGVNIADPDYGIKLTGKRKS